MRAADMTRCRPLCDAQGGEAVQPLMQLPAFPSAVTAIGFAAGATDACPILAVGLEVAPLPITGTRTNARLRAPSACVCPAAPTASGQR